MRSIYYIQFYTDGNDDLSNDIFYDQLILLLGDFNPKLGREEVFRPKIGKHGPHDQCNANELRLGNFAISNNLFIILTLFDQKNIHKQTWISKDGVKNTS